MKSRIPIISLFCLTLLLTCCSTTQTPDAVFTGDGGITSVNNSCTPPCFMGIVPGQTKKEDVSKILDGKTFLICKTKNNEINESTVGNHCINGVAYSYIDEIVSEIVITPSHTNFLRDVIKINGNPNWVSLIAGGTPEEEPYSNVMLLYDNINTILHFSTMRGSAYSLLPNTAIDYIVYSDKITYQEFSRKQQPINWKGYGEYKDY